MRSAPFASLVGGRPERLSTAVPRFAVFGGAPPSSGIALYSLSMTKERHGHDFSASGIFPYRENY